MSVDGSCRMPKYPIQQCSKIILRDKHGNNLISVDYFKNKNNAKYQFLTHAHQIENISHTWIKPIHCSKETALILPRLTRRSESTGVKSRFLRPIDNGHTVTLENNLRVTCFDANHCYGSAMFLFEGSLLEFSPVLCTGHFKADDRFMERFNLIAQYERLRTTKIHTIYFDNLQISDESFLNRDELIERLKNFMLSKPAANIILPIFNLGREEILEVVSEEVGESIELFDARFSLYQSRCAYDTVLGSFVEPSSNSTRIRTIPRDTSALSELLMNSSMQDYYVIDIYKSNLFASVVPEHLFYQLNYTDHSKRSEIFNFFKRITVQHLVPISKPLEEEEATFLRQTQIRAIEKKVPAPVTRVISVKEISNQISMKSEVNKALNSTTIAANNLDTNRLKHSTNELGKSIPCQSRNIHVNDFNGSAKEDKSITLETKPASSDVTSSTTHGSSSSSDNEPEAGNSGNEKSPTQSKIVDEISTSDQTIINDLLLNIVTETSQSIIEESQQNHISNNSQLSVTIEVMNVVDSVPCTTQPTSNRVGSDPRTRKPPTVCNISKPKCSSDASELTDLNTQDTQLDTSSTQQCVGEVETHTGTVKAVSQIEENHPNMDSANYGEEEVQSQLPQKDQNSSGEIMFSQESLGRDSFPRDSNNRELCSMLIEQLESEDSVPTHIEENIQPNNDNDHPPSKKCRPDKNQEISIEKLTDNNYKTLPVSEDSSSVNQLNTSNEVQAPNHCVHNVRNNRICISCVLPEEEFTNINADGIDLSAEVPKLICLPRRNRRPDASFI